MRDDFAVLILSHGRAEDVRTVQTLIECGYTGKWYIIIDNEDNQENLYYTNYGKEHIIKFDKLKKSKEVDSCDIERKRNVVLYARESCFEIAKQLGLKYFLELDDDYRQFRVRYKDNDKLSSATIIDLDSVFNVYLKFLDISNAYAVAFAQGGDFIGGLGSRVYKEKLSRKVMNSFFCKVDRPFKFIGRMNDDVNTYVSEGTRGKLFFTPYNVALTPLTTQKHEGGLTDVYLENGTYVKSFFSVMVAPSCVKISSMGDGHYRIHHLVEWEECTPKIISDRFKNK